MFRVQFNIITEKNNAEPSQVGSSWWSRRWESRSPSRTFSLRDGSGDSEVDVPSQSSGFRFSQRLLPSDPSTRHHRGFRSQVWTWCQSGTPRGTGGRRSFQERPTQKEKRISVPPRTASGGSIIHLSTSTPTPRSPPRRRPGSSSHHSRPPKERGRTRGTLDRTVKNKRTS